ALHWACVSVDKPRPSARYGHTANLIGSLFVVFGGQLGDNFFDDTWSFDIRGEKAAWSLIEPKDGISPPARTGHVSVTFEETIYIIGGTDGQYHYDDTWCFDLQAKQWTELKCTGISPAPREGYACALVGDTIYIFGGRGVDGKGLDGLSALKIS
ncbi:hypothetical protein H0H81_004679, partial [Sphagnurus paluster]